MTERALEKYSRHQSQLNLNLQLPNPLLQPGLVAEDTDPEEVETPEQRKKRIAQAVTESTRQRTSYKQGAPLGQPINSRPRSRDRRNGKAE